MTSFRASCGACKFLRRKCEGGCIFAPYFSDDEGVNHFSAVHKVFGASNVSKLLQNLPVHTRTEAATTISFEALARMHDPVYGCVAHIFVLQQQVAKLQEEIEYLEMQFAAGCAGDVISSHQSSQVWNNTNSGLQMISQLDVMNAPNYHCNQQLPDLSHATNVTRGLILNNEVELQNPLFAWGEQNLCVDSKDDLSSLEKLYLGMDQGIFFCEPVHDITPYAEYASGAYAPTFSF